MGGNHFACYKERRLPCVKHEKWIFSTHPFWFKCIVSLRYHIMPPVVSAIFHIHLKTSTKHVIYNTSVLSVSESWSISIMFICVLWWWSDATNVGDIVASWLVATIIGSTDGHRDQSTWIQGTLCVCVCVCVCARARLPACMHACMHACMNEWMKALNSLHSYYIPYVFIHLLMKLGTAKPAQMPTFSKRPPALRNHCQWPPCMVFSL